MHLRPAPRLRKFQQEADSVLHLSNIPAELFQLNSMVGQGLTSTTNVHSGVSGNAHLHNSGVNPGIDAPVPSEFLGTLSRRLILDLGNPVKAFKVEPNEPRVVV